MIENYYKLAVFGDSYADAGPPESKFYNEAYFNRLKQFYLDDVNIRQMQGQVSGRDFDQVLTFENFDDFDQILAFKNFGLSGASSYWSYYNFKKCVVDLNYTIENAVMTFTDTQRLPITCHELAGVSWKNLFRIHKEHRPFHAEVNNPSHSVSKNYWDSALSHLGLSGTPTVGGFTESDIFSMWNLIFEDNYSSGFGLAQSISVWTLKKSIDLAKQRDVNLVIIIPFNASMDEYLGENPEIIDNHMIITGLDDVSHMETKTHYTNDLVREVRWKDSHVDNRCNHLCSTNNKVLAELIWKGFNGQTGIYDLSEQPGLNFDEIENYADLIYKD